MYLDYFVASTIYGKSVTLKHGKSVRCRLLFCYDNTNNNNEKICSVSVGVSVVYCTIRFNTSQKWSHSRELIDSHQTGVTTDQTYVHLVL